MSDDTSTITYQANLPLAWHVQAAPNAATLALWRHGNIALLRALATIEAVATGDKEHEAEMGKALDRIEAKLDVTLGLLARLVAGASEYPVPAPVTLATRQVEWLAAVDQAPANGSSAALKLYVSPRLPEPLQLWANITTQPVSSDTVRCIGQLIDRDEEFEEWMTRTLFRYHRRALQARHHE